MYYEDKTGKEDPLWKDVYKETSEDETKLL